MATQKALTGKFSFANGGMDGKIPHAPYLATGPDGKKYYAYQMTNRGAGRNEDGDFNAGPWSIGGDKLYAGSTQRDAFTVGGANEILTYDSPEYGEQFAMVAADDPQNVSMNAPAKDEGRNGFFGGLADFVQAAMSTPLGIPIAAATAGALGFGGAGSGGALAGGDLAAFDYPSLTAAEAAQYGAPASGYAGGAGATSTVGSFMSPQRVGGWSTQDASGDWMGAEATDMPPIDANGNPISIPRGNGFGGNTYTGAGLGAAAAGTVGQMFTPSNVAAIGAPVVGGLLSANAASDAAKMQTDATNQATAASTGAANSAIDEQRRQFDLSRSDLAPYREAGTSALSSLRALMEGGSLTRKFTLDDFWSDPVTKASYQAGLDAGTEAIDKMAGARGMRNSGQTLKALSQFGTDYTGGQAAGSQARFVGDQNNTYNKYAGMAGTGQAATVAGAGLGASTATNIGNIGMTNATNVGNLMTGGANARGAAAISGSNALGAGLNTVGNWWTGQQNLDKILEAQRNRPLGY